MIADISSDWTTFALHRYLIDDYRDKLILNRAARQTKDVRIKSNVYSTWLSYIPMSISRDNTCKYIWIFIVLSDNHRHMCDHHDLSYLHNIVRFINILFSHSRLRWERIIVIGGKSLIILLLFLKLMTNSLLAIICVWKWIIVIRHGKERKPILTAFLFQSRKGKRERESAHAWTKNTASSIIQLSTRLTIIIIYMYIQ